MTNWEIARGWCRAMGWREAANLMAVQKTGTPEWFLATCGDLLPRRPLTDRELKRKAWGGEQWPTDYLDALKLNIAMQTPKTGAGAIQYGVGGSYIV